LISETELKEIILKTITLYNRHKMPEATAKLVHVSQIAVTVSFTGSFCYNCSVMDYLEDFIGDFKILTDKVELKIGKTRQTSPRSFEADYIVKEK
jgi:hypothetical protein